MRGSKCKLLRRTAREIADLIITGKTKPEIIGFIYKLNRGNMKTIRHTYRALKRNVNAHTLKIEDGLISN